MGDTWDCSFLGSSQSSRGQSIRYYNFEHNKIFAQNFFLLHYNSVLILDEHLHGSTINPDFDWIFKSVVLNLAVYKNNYRSIKRTDAFLFQARWSDRDWLNNTPTETTKRWTKHMKQWLALHWTLGKGGVISLRWWTNRWALWLLQLIAFSVSRLQHRERKTHQSPRDS